MNVRKYWRIAQSGLVLGLVRGVARLAPLPKVLAWLHHEPSLDALAAPDRAVLEDLVYFTDRWLTIFPANAKGNCFPRSLTLYWFARRLGFPVGFHCGIQRNGQALDGHAWLSLNGTAFLEATRHWEGFAVTYSYPDRQGQGTAREMSESEPATHADVPQQKRTHG